MRFAKPGATILTAFYARIIAYFLIFISTGAILGVYASQESQRAGTTAAASNPLIQVVFGLIYLFLLFVLITEREEIFAILVRENGCPC